MVSSTMGCRISLMATSNSMNKVKAPVSAYPVKRVALLSMALTLFWPNECPQDTERVLGLGVTVAPEHVLGLHGGGATGVDGALPPAVHVFHRQHQRKAGERNKGMAAFGKGVAQHHGGTIDE